MNRNCKKTLCVLLMLCIISTNSFAMNTMLADEQLVAIQPRFNYIIEVSVGLGIELDGMAICDTGVTLYESNHDGKIEMTLQRYKNNDWQDVKSWTITDDGPNVDLTEYWYVVSGYDYRVVSDVYVYNANGRVIEITTEYSPIVEF